MKRVIGGTVLGLIVVMFFGCGIGDSKFVRKRIKAKDVEIDWYYHSYISGNSPDFVAVRKHEQRRIVYEAKNVISDVTIRDDRIILKLYNPEQGLVYTDSVMNQVFGYKVVLDSNVTFDEYKYRPGGVLEK